MMKQLILMINQLRPEHIVIAILNNEDNDVIKVLEELSCKYRYSNSSNTKTLSRLHNNSTGR